MKMFCNNPHVAIPKKVLDDPNLSLGAKGLFCLVCCGDITTEDIGKKKLDSTIAINNYMDELVKAGYVEEVE